MTEALVRTPETEEEFEVVERLDDEQIIKYITRGELVKKAVYHFRTNNGVDVYDLSWAGAKMIAQLLGNIHLKLEKETIVGNELIIATYSCLDILRNMSMNGTAQAEFKGYGGKLNPFAAPLSHHKAQRNAIKNTLIQAPLYLEVIRLYKINERMEAEDILRLTTKDNINRYNFDYNKVLDYCNKQFNKETLDEMGLEELNKLSSILSIKEGKDLFLKEGE